jgi:hypothetical protein
MSDRALQEFQAVRQKQSDRFQARRIRSLVRDAKGAYDAGIRWPFELLQNATDAGPRSGKTVVTISISFDANKVSFTHDGAPFTLQELAALISGGSSKQFESDDTTGRFGTGFLVTHVLAEQTRVRGLLLTNHGLERFDLTINRAGDEDQILNNIEVCNHAISLAEPVENLPNEPSAVFEYMSADTKAFLQGIDTLREALPFLFATRIHLGTIQLSGSDGVVETWSPGDAQVSTQSESVVTTRDIRLESSAETAPAEYKVFRVARKEDANFGIIFAALQANDVWNICPLLSQAPKIYIRFPLRSSNFLSANLILDGMFDPHTERSTILLTDKTKSLVADSLNLVGPAVRFAVDSQINGAHLLAQIGTSRDAFQSLPNEEKNWWVQHLRSVAEKLAAMPIVETRIGKLPAVRFGHQRVASFIKPKWSQSQLDSAPTERLWPLVDSVNFLFPPLRSLAEDWSRIAENWRELGIKVEQVSLETLAAVVRSNVQRIEELPLSIDPWEWIASLFDVVGEIAAQRHNVDTDLLEGLLPDQNGRFCTLLGLQRDGGVPERVKDIADEIGFDVRATLLNCKIEEAAVRLKLRHTSEAITKAIPKVLSENDLVEQCIARLEKELREDEQLAPSQQETLTGSIKLLAYLWDKNGPASSEIARKCALVASNNNVVRWSPARMMMAPVTMWDERSRPFYEAYPPGRVLSETYLGSKGNGISSVCNALIGWGMAHKDPLGKYRPGELKDERLAALAVSGHDSTGLTVSGEQFSQICLLQPEVINHCRENIKDARALLGLVLCYVAREDRNWQSTRLVTGRRAGVQTEISIYEALWLADLKVKSWVPVVGEGGKTSPSIAKADSLKELLQPEWLVNNPDAVNLLTSFFGFDRLELQLLGVADAGIRQEIRDSLAKFVELAEANPSAIEEFSKEFEERQQRSTEIQRCRTLGLAVQSAVGAALELRHLRVKLVDRGFDFEVTLGEEAGFRFEVGPFLVEVKTTTSGEVRMTPTQAETASNESRRYFLCVIDLRSVAPARLDGPWAAIDIEPFARVIGDIGLQTKVTYDLVGMAKANEVGIRNEKALRYAVPVEIWERGSSISDWIDQIANTLTQSVP